MYISSFILSFNLENKTLIINGLNGHADIINTSLWNKLKREVNKNCKHFNPRLIKKLQKRQYIFSNIQEEQGAYNEISTKVVNKFMSGKNLSISINFSEDCNLACPYCVSGTRRKQKRMTRLHIDKIWEIIKLLDQKGYKINQEITLFGGEPLMLQNRLLLKRFLQKIRSSRYKVFIITNGVTINEYISEFKRFKNQIKGFQITVDGPSEIHNKRRIGPDYPKTFSIITSNIQKLLKLNVEVYLRTNIDEKNLPYLPELARFIVYKKWHKNEHFHPHLALIQKYCMTSCSQNPRSQSTKYIQKFRSMVEKYPELSIYHEVDFYNNPQKFLMNILANKNNYPKITYCMTAGARSYTFAADNNIYACMASVGIKEFSLGKYFPKFVWNSKNLNKWENRLSINMQKCKKCPLIFICGGNCPLASYEKYSDINMPSCNQAIKNLEKFVRMNKKKILEFAKSTKVSRM